MEHRFYMPKAISYQHFNGDLPRISSGLGRLSSELLVLRFTALAVLLTKLGFRLRASTSPSMILFNSLACKGSSINAYSFTESQLAAGRAHHGQWSLMMICRSIDSF